MGASAPDPKDEGITGTPGNVPEVAGERSAAMIMAYINGDWQYVYCVLGSKCERQRALSQYTCFGPSLCKENFITI